MHHVNKIRALTDEISENELYQMIGYLQGAISLDDAVLNSHCYKEMFLNHLDMALDVVRMVNDNESAIRKILSQPGD